jgi:hypothetical protein
MSSSPAETEFLSVLDFELSLPVFSLLAPSGISKKSPESESDEDFEASFWLDFVLCGFS